MVREGADSTVRPKVQTYGFDNGKIFLDSWAADGKPMLSRQFQGWTRVLGVFTVTAAAFSLVLSDWSTVTQSEEHVFSSLQRGVRSWWATFVEMDEFDVAKARSVGRQKPASSFFASESAQDNFAREAEASAAARAKEEGGAEERRN